jgi:hypothetical protein
LAQRAAYGVAISATAVTLVSAPLRAQDSAAAKPAGSGKWQGAIPTLNGGVRGAADVAVQSQGDKESRVRVTVRNMPINRQVAWDVVAGSCGDEGRPVAAGAAFRMLLTRNDGSGDAMARVPRLEAGKRYYVRLFNPGEVPSDRAGLACANLSEVP